MKHLFGPVLQAFSELRAKISIKIEKPISFLIISLIKSYIFASLFENICGKSHHVTFVQQFGIIFQRVIADFQ